MELFRFRRKNKNKIHSLKTNELVSLYLSYPEHFWICDDKYIKSCFEDFLKTIPKKILVQITSENGVRFMPSSGKFGCAIPRAQSSIVLLFPEVISLLKSTAITNVKGILAHELGHILLNHGNRNISTLNAQVEADRFACDLGYLEEIENFLLDLPESVEKRVRLSYLTSYMFS